MPNQDASSSSSTSSIDVGKIIIVSLDINIHNEPAEKVQGFFNLTAREKIELISKRIDLICEEFTSKYPKAMWVIGWKEYGITEDTSRFLSLEAVGFLKESMLKLTNKYQNLRVIAGTVAVKRFFPQLQYQKARPKILKEYKLLGNPLSAMTERHRKRVELLEVGRDDKGRTTGIDVVSNTSYFFEGNEVKKHRKTTPYLETIDESVEVIQDLPNTIYRLASLKTSNPIITTHHPETKKEIPIKVEICAEHEDGMLSAQPALLHFIVSDSIPINPSKISGEAVIQFDSYFKTQHIQSQSTSALDVEVFQHNLLNPLVEKTVSSSLLGAASIFPPESKDKAIEKELLKGPLKPYFPLELQIIKILDKAIEQLELSEAYSLEDLREKFLGKLLTMTVDREDPEGNEQERVNENFETLRREIGVLSAGRELKSESIYINALKEVVVLAQQYGHVQHMNSVMDSPIVTPSAKLSPG